jgi:anti-sigma B factor antagonist
VLDLRGLTFCETAGMHVMLDAHQRARRDGTRLVLVAAPPAVHRGFVLTGVDRRLDFIPAE